MRKVFDLSSYLQEEKAVIKLGNDVYEINNGFNDLLRIDALSERRGELSSTEFVKEFLKISLGDVHGEELLSKNYPLPVYMEVMRSIEKTFGDSDDETEGASTETEGVQKPQLV